MILRCRCYHSSAETAIRSPVEFQLATSRPRRSCLNDARLSGRPSPISSSERPPGTHKLPTGY